MPKKKDEKSTVTRFTLTMPGMMVIADEADGRIKSSDVYVQLADVSGNKYYSPGLSYDGVPIFTPGNYYSRQFALQMGIKAAELGHQKSGQTYVVTITKEDVNDA